jgi:hypothetical protein
VALAVVLAAVARLWRLDLVEFKADEASALRITEDMLRLGHFPETGMLSSQGILQAPHLMYLLAPMVAITRDPALVSGAIAVLNIGAVLGAAWLAWRWFGGLAAVVTTLLYATNPWAVFWSRKIWAPDFLPLFALLLCAVVVESRGRWAALAYPITALASMVHFSFITLAPVLIAPTFVLARCRRWWPLALGGGAALLILLPFLAHEHRIDWLDYPTLRYELSRRATRVDGQGLDFALGLTTGLGATTLAGVPLPRVAPAPLLVAAAVLETAVLLGAVAHALARLARHRATSGLNRRRLVFLLVWIGLPILLTARHAFDLHDHYFLLLYPAPFLVIGAAFAWLTARRERWARSVLACGLAAVLATSVMQLATVAGLYAHLDRAFDACYDLPLVSSQALTQDIVDFGQRLGATRATVELDEADAMPIAYLLRPHYAHLEMQRYGDLGLGLAQADASSASSAQVLGVWTPSRPVPDWRPRLAIVWTPPQQSVHWRVELDDGQSFNGISHRLAGERMLSWFTFEVPREVPAGPHVLTARLTDDATGAALAETSQSVAVNSSPRCS